MRKYLIVLAALILSGCVSTSSPVGTGLNPSAPPTYGSAAFRPGQTLNVAIDAGGQINTQDAIGPNCFGYVYNVPDYVVRFETAGTATITFNVQSSIDPTLVIYTPDGRWLCNDDGGGGFDALIRIPSAQAGNYVVWVGTYVPLGEYPSTTLRVY